MTHDPNAESNCFQLERSKVKALEVGETSRGMVGCGGGEGGRVRRGFVTIAIDL